MTSGAFSSALLLAVIVWLAATFVWGAKKSTAIILTGLAAALGWWIAGLKPSSWQTQNQNVDATPNVGF
jgi:hypothetical protein